MVEGEPTGVDPIAWPPSHGWRNASDVPHTTPPVSSDHCSEETDRSVRL